MIKFPLVASSDFSWPAVISYTLSAHQCSTDLAGARTLRLSVSHVGRACAGANPSTHILTSPSYGYSVISRASTSSSNPPHPQTLLLAFLPPHSTNRNPNLSLFQQHFRHRLSRRFQLLLVLPNLCERHLQRTRLVNLLQLRDHRVHVPALKYQVALCRAQALKV